MPGLLSRLAENVATAPDWLMGVRLVAVASIAAVLLHLQLVRSAQRALARRAGFVSAFLAQTIGPSRLALVTFAVAGALELAPLAPGVRDAFVHVLLLAFIFLI